MTDNYLNDDDDDDRHYFKQRDGDDISINSNNTQILYNHLGNITGSDGLVYDNSVVTVGYYTDTTNCFIDLVVGHNNNISNSNQSLIVGIDIESHGSRSIMVGKEHTNNNLYNAIFGRTHRNTGTSNLITGRQNIVDSSYSITGGLSTVSTQFASYSFVHGYQAYVNGTNSFVMGSRAKSHDGHQICLGYQCNAYDSAHIGFGKHDGRGEGSITFAACSPLASASTLGKSTEIEKIYFWARNNRSYEGGHIFQSGDHHYYKQVVTKEYGNALTFSFATVYPGRWLDIPSSVGEALDDLAGYSQSGDKTNGPGVSFPTGWNIEPTVITHTWHLNKDAVSGVIQCNGGQVNTSNANIIIDGGSLGTVASGSGNVIAYKDTGVFNTLLKYKSNQLIVWSVGSSTPKWFPSPTLGVTMDALYVSYTFVLS